MRLRIGIYLLQLPAGKLLALSTKVYNGSLQIVTVWPLRQNCTIGFNVLFANYTILCTPFWEDFLLSERPVSRFGSIFSSVCQSVHAFWDDFSSGSRTYYQFSVLSKLSHFCTVVSYVLYLYDY